MARPRSAIARGYGSIILGRKWPQNHDEGKLSSRCWRVRLDRHIGETAGLIAGSWCASPATHVGHELIAARMLILADGEAGKGVSGEAAQRALAHEAMQREADRDAQYG